MATVTGTGASDGTDSFPAATAARGALAALGGARPAAGFLFASSRHELGRALTVAREITGIALLGCTTAGEITQRGLTHGGVSVLLIATQDMELVTATAGDVKRGHAAAADTLTQRFRVHAGRARKRGFGLSTTVTLVDGLCGSGEQLVKGLADRTSATHQIVGGAAGDDGAFKATHVGCDPVAGVDHAAALHAFGAKPWGVGVGHGLEPASRKMIVTRARDNIVYQIDKRPAFELYQEHARSRGLELQRQAAGEYLIGNELGLFLAGQVVRARAPLGVGDDGSLVLAAPIPEGASICILDGKPASMIAAVEGAAREALHNLDGARPAGVLLFDCICRGMILKDAFQREIDAIRSVLGPVPIGGFLTYGEIASYRGKLDGWHNATAVVVAIPA